MKILAEITMTPLRKAAVLVTGGTVFSSSMYLSYHFQRMEKQASEFADHRQRHRSGDEGNSGDYKMLTSTCVCSSCYLNDPERNHRYDIVAKQYDDSVQCDEFLMGMNLLRRFLLYFYAKGTVLEMGAGTGRNLRYYPINETNDTQSSNKVDRLILTDLSEPMLRQAKEKIASLPKQRQKRIATLVANAENELRTKLPDNSFDTVVDTFGLCSYNDPIAVLNEMKRLCKKTNGRILLLKHGRSHSNSFVTKYLDKFAEQHAYNWGCVWNRDIDDILKQSNVVIERMHKFHFGTTYFIVCRPLSPNSPEEASKL